jgi:hypothetical protein
VCTFVVDSFLVLVVDGGNESDVPSGVLCVQLVWGSTWREGPLHTLVLWQAAMVSVYKA